MNTAMSPAHLRASAKEKDMLADHLARNPGFHRKTIRDLRIQAADLRSQALMVEQRRDVCQRCGREAPFIASPCPKCQEAA